MTPPRQSSSYPSRSKDARAAGRERRLAKSSPLSADRLRELLSYDPSTGIFVRIKSTCNRVKVGSVAGSPNSNGYLQISLGGRLYLASRLAFLYMTGEWPNEIVDHRNTDRLDNRWINLREATPEVNAQNRRRALKSNKVGLLGVHLEGSRYYATIRVDGKKRSLGSFATPDDAYRAYVDAKRQFHEGSTL